MAISIDSQTVQFITPSRTTMVRMLSSRNEMGQVQIRYWVANGTEGRQVPVTQVAHLCPLHHVAYLDTDYLICPKCNPSGRVR